MWASMAVDSNVAEDYRPLNVMAMADDALTAIRGLETSMLGERIRNLGLDGFPRRTAMPGGCRNLRITCVSGWRFQK
jgi:hypothetical protein